MELIKIFNDRRKKEVVLKMFGEKSSISNPYYPMSHDDLKDQDSGIIGNIAASNAIWVETYGTRRKKGNRKKSDSLRHIAPIDYNEGSNEEDEEEVFGSDVEGFDYQFHSDIPISSHKKDKKATPKRLSSSDPSPSSFLKPAAKPKIKSEPAAKGKKKREILELIHSDSDDSLLLGEKNQSKWMTWI
jgi:hypothetical protein